MAKKNVNPSELTIRTCCECGRRLHRKDTNCCDECLERILGDTEKSVVNFMRNETTSKSVASKASKILRDKDSSPDEKAVAASALTQAGGSENPNLAAFTLLADHVREFIYKDGGNVDRWKSILAEDLKRIDEGK